MLFLVWPFYKYVTLYASFLLGQTQKQTKNKLENNKFEENPKLIS